MTDPDDDEGGWKFELDDLPAEDRDETSEGVGTPGAADGAATGDDPDAESDDAGNVAGSIVADRSVEPGSPTAENAAFVLVGALVTILLVVAMLGFI